MADFIWFFTIFLAVYLGSLMAMITAVWYFEWRKKKDDSYIDTSTPEGRAAAINLANQFPTTETSSAMVTGNTVIPVSDYPPPYTAD